MTRSFILALLLCLIAARPSFATVVLPADLAELVAGARAIACGRIAEIRAEWADGRRRIDTFVTIEVATYFKGDLGRLVTFRVPGGELGRYQSLVVGAPRFEEGDEVVLFLSAHGPSVPYVLGLGQGVYRVLTDPQSGQPIVTPPPLLSAGERPQRILRGDHARRPMPLDEFEATVRTIVASQIGQANDKGGGA